LSFLVILCIIVFISFSALIVSHSTGILVSHEGVLRA
jgi:hypothetical protein